MVLPQLDHLSLHLTNEYGIFEGITWVCILAMEINTPLHSKRDSTFLAIRTKWRDAEEVGVVVGVMMVLEKRSKVLV